MKNQNLLHLLLCGCKVIAFPRYGQHFKPPKPSAIFFFDIGQSIKKQALPTIHMPAELITKIY